MLDELGLKYDTDKASHAHDYLDIYERIIKPKFIRSVLEIGVFQGASLKMWREWFPAQTKIVGMDINEIAPIDGCEIVRGDQNDLNDLACVVRRYGMFDIIIDDGCHQEDVQRRSFEFLSNWVVNGGLYFVEDVGAFGPQYWPQCPPWLRIASRHKVGGLELAVYRA